MSMDVMDASSPFGIERPSASWTLEFAHGHGGPGLCHEFGEDPGNSDLFISKLTILLLYSPKHNQTDFEIYVKNMSSPGVGIEPTSMPPQGIRIPLPQPGRDLRYPSMPEIRSDSEG